MKTNTANGRKRAEKCISGLNACFGAGSGNSVGQTRSGNFQKSPFSIRQNHFAMSVSDFPPGETRIRMGESRFPVEQNRFPVEQNRFAMGLSRFAMGLSRFAVGLSRFAVGLSRFAVGLSRFAVGLNRFAMGLSRFAVGQNRERESIGRNSRCFSIKGIVPAEGENGQWKYADCALYSPLHSPSSLCRVVCGML
jgi:hypothetical protein